MGQSVYGISAGSLSNGGGYTTAAGNYDKHIAAAKGVPAHTLLVAVSAAIVAPTGTVAGTMASGTKATLAASYVVAAAAGL